MSPLPPQTSTQRSRRERWLVVVSLLAVAGGCSVYDSSLIKQGDRLSGGDAGQSDAVGDGGMPASPAGGTSEGAQGGRGGAAGGSPAEAGTASVGGSAGGVSGGAGAMGGAGTGGPAGGGTNNGGTGGASGSGGSGGNARVLQQLAVGKTATASSQETGHEAAKGNDKDLTTRWCASNGVYPQWWRVDLGATHELTQVAIRFEHADRTYAYIIETSNDDKVYTQQRTASGTSALQTLDMPADVTARYVRVTVNSGLPASVNGNGTWASFFDFTVQGY